MATDVEEPEHHYEEIDCWAKLPDGWSFNEVSAVAIDSADQIYVFSRSEHPMTVFDRNGNFLRSWGEGVYQRPHGAHIGQDGHIYLTDDGVHIVHKCTLDGKVLLELGERGKPAPYMSGRPFHRCTHTALAPNGDIYVSDGYGNSRVHQFSPAGKLLMSWGEPGSSPGQFNIPHNICCNADGWVYVADRENHRIQVFDGNGRYETQWNNLHRPCAMFMTGGRCPCCYVGEIGPAMAVNRDVPNLGPRISILDGEGNLRGRVGGTVAGTGPKEFIAPHGIAVDSHGDIYVGEVSRTQWGHIFPGQPVPSVLRSMRKFRRFPAV